MNDIGTYLVMILSALVAAGLALVGGIDVAIEGLAMLILLDIITGIMKAVVTKTLSSDVSFRGAVKKIAIFVVIALCHVMDGIIGTEDTMLLRNGAIFFYSVYEGISILENIAEIGLPIPPVIKEALDKLNKRTTGK